ncbi:MAG: hypothetical protein IT289_07605 [Oligoflexia bacterium]|nr:hypothetical protein [Oligoflexia bacterium]
MKNLILAAITLTQFSIAHAAPTKIICHGTADQWMQSISFDWDITLDQPTANVATVILTNNLGGKPSTSTSETDYSLTKNSSGFVYTFTEGNGYEWTVTTKDNRQGVLYYSEGLSASCRLK